MGKFSWIETNYQNENHKPVHMYILGFFSLCVRFVEDRLGFKDKKIFVYILNSEKLYSQVAFTETWLLYKEHMNTLLDHAVSCSSVKSKHRPKDNS